MSPSAREERDDEEYGLVLAVELLTELSRKCKWWTSKLAWSVSYPLCCEVEVCEGTDFKLSEGEVRRPKLVGIPVIPALISRVLGEIAAEHTLGREVDCVE